MKRNWMDSMSDLLNYVNGGFYSNKIDDRYFVPKEYPGIGWNLNFGNPKAVRFFILSIIIVLGLFIAFIVFLK